MPNLGLKFHAYNREQAEILKELISGFSEAVLRDQIKFHLEQMELETDKKRKAFHKGAAVEAKMIKHILDTIEITAAIPSIWGSCNVRT